MSALVGIPVILATAYFGGPVFLFFVLLLALLARQEVADLGQRREMELELSLSLSGVVASITLAYIQGEAVLGPVMVATLLTVLTWQIISFRTFSWFSAIYTLFGIFYTGILPAYLVLLRGRPEGLHWLLVVLLGTWGTDTLAYFGGSRWGKRKLSPQISPNKTLEGALAGLFGAVMIVLLYGFWLGWPLLKTMALGLAIGIAAQLGDLSESSLKRFVGVKDSGHLIPGHGGVLDRFDSLLFSAPVAYYFFTRFFG
ncbi:MAG: phosphatidate cytidylyltransferase [Firmicutes bacterium]|nr:phosphatidate cytidylyltransferase [Bacillota bacterium]